MNIRVGVTITLVFLQTGCSSLPIPVKNDISYLNKVTTDKSKLPYGDLSSIDSAQISMQKHSIMYREEVLQKRKKAQYASETTFYSSIIGVIGGLTKSFTTALTGGLGAAGSGLYSDRYRLEVQGINYENAADGMDCMNIATMKISRIVNLNSFKISYKSNLVDNQSAAFDSLEIAIDGILKIRKKLETLQSRFELGKPDPIRIKDAVSQAHGSATKPNDKGLPAKMTAQEMDESKRIEEYKSKIDICVATFS